ncbi:MAG: C4-dicarboxylate TRAP transporter substrate-binding protein [Alphaproteobacteria bacterium]
MSMLKSGLLTGAIFALAIGQVCARELTYSNHLPPAHPVNKAMEGYFAGIRDKTGGELDFQMFVAGALGGGKALLSNLRDGLADTGMLNPVYDPSELKVESLLAELMVADPKVLVGAMNEMVNLDCAGCTAELREVNAVPMMSFAVPSFQLLCNRPVKSMADAAGVKVRAVGSLSLIATTFGMVPVNLTSDEVYEGLQRGQIDCAAAPFDWLRTNNLAEVTTDLIEDPLGAIGGLLHFAVNAYVWDELSAEERAILIDGLGKTLAEMTFAYAKGSADALAAAREGGAAVYPLGEDMAKALADFRAAEVGRIVAKAKEAGVEDADGLFDRYDALLDKWTGIVAEVGADEAAYAAALDREIFSKMPAE